MTLQDAWKKANYGDSLTMADKSTYPLVREKKTYGFLEVGDGDRYNLIAFCRKELGDATVNILREDWEVIPRREDRSPSCPFCKGSGFRTDVFENEFILQELSMLADNLKTATNKESLIDRTTCILTAFMNGIMTGRDCR